MRVGVIGYRGQLGSELVKALGDEYLEVPLVDIRNDLLTGTAFAFPLNKPDVIINCAAIHDLNQCELDPLNAFDVNTIGAQNVARYCKFIGAKCVYISTGYVFDGCEPLISYDEYDSPNPINIYGISKYAGELAVAKTLDEHFIIRVHALYGVTGPRTKKFNFIDNIVNQLNGLTVEDVTKQIPVVSDQYITPTSAKNAAERIIDLVRTTNYGTYHLTDYGGCSWFTLAKYVNDTLGLSTLYPMGRVVPIKSYATDILRPRNTQLTTIRMQYGQRWQDAVRTYLVEKGYITQLQLQCVEGIEESFTYKSNI